MSTKKLFILMITILISGVVKSQISTNNSLVSASNGNLIEHQLENYYNDVMNNKIGDETIMSYDKIKGDPFIYKDFEKGTIKFEKDTNIVGLLRYNMYTDEVEFKYHNSQLVLVYEDAFSGVKIGEYDLVQLPDPAKIDNAPGYFIYLTKGKYSLLVKKSVTFKEEDEPKLMVESKPGRFEKDPNKYYLMSDNNELYEIKSIKKLKKFSTDMEASAEEYIANNKLKVNPESLSGFVSWLNNK